MLRKTMIALFAAASVSVLVPDIASARGGFGGGGFRSGLAGPGFRGGFARRGFRGGVFLAGLGLGWGWGDGWYCDPYYGGYGGNGCYGGYGGYYGGYGWGY